MRYSEMWPKYAAWWDKMTVHHESELAHLAHFALDHKAQYAAVEAAVSLPWEMAAAIHRRESDANFNTYFGNGQPLNRVTTIVPKGRGPFTGANAFVRGAIDAVQIEGWGNVLDWRLEKMLYHCELFNGAGYHMHGVPSPYVWGWTNIQQPGKYDSDGHWNPRLMDSQPGCAAIIAAIAKLDPTVKLVRES